MFRVNTDEFIFTIRQGRWWKKKNKSSVYKISKDKHLPQYSDAALRPSSSDVSMWCHLHLHHRGGFCCGLGLAVFFPLLSSFLQDKLPLLGQLLPWATERSQTAVFYVIGPFGGRTPTEEVRRSNPCQTVGATLPISVTNHDCWAADSRGRAARSLITISSAWWEISA